MSRIGRAAIILTIAIVALIGVSLVGGGIWLILLGGSWYYLLAGLGFCATAVLLVRRRSAALGLYAFVVIATLAWALWEAGLDWWRLAARGDLVFLVGIVLLLPFVTGRLVDRSATPGRQASALRGSGLALSSALAASVVVAVASWLEKLKTKYFACVSPTFFTACQS
jgi:quinoprotein glucose dehydrogenase